MGYWILLHLKQVYTRPWGQDIGLPTHLHNVCIWCSCKWGFCSQRYIFCVWFQGLSPKFFRVSRRPQGTAFLCGWQSIFCWHLSFNHWIHILFLMFCELIKDSLCSHCEFGPNKLGCVVAFLTVSVADYRFWPLCPVPRLSGFALDVPGIVKAVQEHRPKLVFLTSPNNPDGW